MTMIFDEDTAVWDGAVGMVRFYGHDWGHMVECGVSREAIERHCEPRGGEPADLLRAFRTWIETIRAAALERYQIGAIEPCGVILVRADDLARARGDRSAPIPAAGLIAVVTARGRTKA